MFPTNCRSLKAKEFPRYNILSNSCKEANNMFKRLGIEYISYHACLNDCILYKGEYADNEISKKCGNDRYTESNNKDKAHGPPHKILRHVPIIPRIQRIFHSK